MIDPNDYWVNNPLITPINKAMMYDNNIWMAKMDMCDKIIDWIEKNRTVTEVEAGINIVRDHFSSDDLINAIKSGQFDS